MKRIMAIISIAVFWGITGIYGMEQNAAAPVSQDMAKRFFNAVVKNNVAQVREFLDLGVPVDVRDCDGQTALTRIVFIHADPYPFYDMAKVLIEHGANVHEKNCFGLPIIFNVIYWHPLDLVKLFMKHGADSNAIECSAHHESDGTTALMAAVFRKSPEFSRCLIESGAAVNARDWDGQTALWRASDAGYKETAQFLVEHGADVFARAFNGMMPIDVVRFGLMSPRARVYPWVRISLQETFDYLAPFEERRCILVALLVCDELGCAKDKDFPPELMAKGWPFAEIMESVVRGDGQ